MPTDRFDQKHWEALQAPLADYCSLAVSFKRDMDIGIDVEVDSILAV